MNPLVLTEKKDDDKLLAEKLNVTENGVDKTNVDPLVVKDAINEIAEIVHEQGKKEEEKEEEKEDVKKDVEKKEVKKKEDEKKEVEEKDDIKEDEVVIENKEDDKKGKKKKKKKKGEDDGEQEDSEKAEYLKKTLVDEYIERKTKARKEELHTISEMNKRLAKQKENAKDTDKQEGSSGSLSTAKKGDDKTDQLKKLAEEIKPGNKEEEEEDKNKKKEDPADDLKERLKEIKIEDEEQNEIVNKENDEENEIVNKEHDEGEGEAGKTGRYLTELDKDGYWPKNELPGEIVESKKPKGFFGKAKAFGTNALNKTMKYGLPYGSDAVNALSAMGTAYMGLKTADMSKEDAQQFNNDHSKISTGSSLLSLGTAGVGALQSTIGAVKSYKTAHNSNNYRKKIESVFSTINGGIGIASSSFKAASSILALRGQGTSNVNKGLGIAASALGFGSSLLGVLGGATDFASRSVIKHKLQKQYNKDEDANNAKENELKQALADTDKNDKEAYLESKKKLRSFKLKKYALQDAASFHSAQRWANAPKNLIGSLTTGLGTLSSVLSTVFPDSSGIKKFKAVTPIIATVGGFLNRAVGHIADHVAKKKMKSKKFDIINNYLKNKRAKLKDEIKELKDNNENVDNNKYLENVSDGALDRITIARMGVDIKISNADASDAEKMEGFKALNIKRARNILEASAEDKKSMLSALGLSSSATLDEVASALTGDT